MIELPLALGGFFLAHLAFTAVARWVATLYAEVVHQLPELRRPRIVWPLLVLHSGPWMTALVAFLSFKVATAPPAPWRTWLAAGFAVGLLLQLMAFALAWRRLTAGRAKAHKR